MVVLHTARAPHSATPHKVRSTHRRPPPARAVAHHDVAGAPNRTLSRHRSCPSWRRSAPARPGHCAYKATQRSRLHSHSLRPCQGQETCVIACIKSVIAHPCAPGLGDGARDHSWVDRGVWQLQGRALVRAPPGDECVVYFQDFQPPRRTARWAAHCPRAASLLVQCALLAPPSRWRPW